jgi:hypothetical protein
VAQFFYFILIKVPGSDPKKFYSVTKTTADQGLPVFVWLIHCMAHRYFVFVFFSGNPLIKAWPILSSSAAENIFVCKTANVRQTVR